MSGGWLRSFETSKIILTAPIKLVKGKAKYLPVDFIELFLVKAVIALKRLRMNLPEKATLQVPPIWGITGNLNVGSKDGLSSHTR